MGATSSLRFLERSEDVFIVAITLGREFIDWKLHAER